MRKFLSASEARGLRAIRGFVMKEGRFPSVRELQRSLDYASPRSAAWILGRLRDKGYLRRRPDGRLQLARESETVTSSAQTVDVPLVGSVSCGSLLLAEENIEGTFPVATRLASPPYQYFILRASGDSMDQSGINDGDLLLVRQQCVARNGDSVVALVDGEATVKEFHISKGAIVLMPKSSNSAHRPIVLTVDFRVQGVVVTSFPDPTRMQEEERTEEGD